MTDQEILDWASYLTFTESELVRLAARRTMHPINQQIEIITDLLDHSNGDGMSGEDVTICRRAIILLQAKRECVPAQILEVPESSTEIEDEDLETGGGSVWSYEN